MPLPQLSQIDEVAQRMRRSRATVRRWVHNGRVISERRATVIYIHVDGSGIALNPPRRGKRRKARRYSR